MGLWARLKGLTRGLLTALGGSAAIAHQDLDDTGVIELDMDGDGIYETRSAPLAHERVPPRH